MPKVEQHRNTTSNGTPPTKVLLKYAAAASEMAPMNPHTMPHRRRPIIGETMDTTILPTMPAAGTNTKYPAAAGTEIPSSSDTIVGPHR